MKSDSKKYIIAMAINTGIVIVYYILAFLIIPNAPVLSFIEEDLDIILISLPIMIISVVMVICRKSFRVWVIPDIVFCVLVFATSSENFHPYGVGLFGFGPVSKTYERKVALIESAIILIVLLGTQLAAKLVSGLVVRLKSKSTLDKS